MECDANGDVGATNRRGSRSGLQNLVINKHKSKFRNYSLASIFSKICLKIEATNLIASGSLL